MTTETTLSESIIEIIEGLINGLENEHKCCLAIDTGKKLYDLVEKCGTEIDRGRARNKFKHLCKIAHPGAAARGEFDGI